MLALFPTGGGRVVTLDSLAALRFEPEAHLSLFQELLSMPRETLPQLTATAARAALTRAAAMLGLDFIEIAGVAPTFLLLPRSGTESAEATLLGSWHAESAPVVPAAVEGSERLALAASVGALSAIRDSGLRRPALVVAPATGHGSMPLATVLAEHRALLQAPVAFWPRIAPATSKRRRVFLGGRGRAVLGLWGEGANAYEVRDRLVEELSREAFGPRPLDFELLRKLAGDREALDFLEESIEDPDSVAGEGEGETRLRNALFEPRGAVHRPPVRHPDRPTAWISLDLAEAMEPSDVVRRAQSYAGSSKVEIAEAFAWDRQNIHHPATQALIQTAKTQSEGAEIWPLAPWVTPSGLFTRALGTPLSEWRVPLPKGTAVRFPKPDALEAVEREIAELLLRGAGLLKKGAS